MLMSPFLDFTPISNVLVVVVLDADVQDGVPSVQRDGELLFFLPWSANALLDSDK